jgi:hypothetical protein
VHALTSPPPWSTLEDPGRRAAPARARYARVARGILAFGPSDSTR